MIDLSDTNVVGKMFCIDVNTMVRQYNDAFFPDEIEDNDNYTEYRIFSRKTPCSLLICVSPANYDGVAWDTAVAGT